MKEENISLNHKVDNCEKLTLKGCNYEIPHDMRSFINFV